MIMSGVRMYAALLQYTSEPERERKTKFDQRFWAGLPVRVSLLFPCTCSGNASRDQAAPKLRSNFSYHRIPGQLDTTPKMYFLLEKLHAK